MSVALTNIVHGLEDGTRVVVKAGEEIADQLEQDVVDVLKKTGAIGEPVVAAVNTAATEEKAALEAEVADLKAQLEEALAKQNSPT
jgi:translation elongation factor EF-Tu-like GTPase